MQNALFFSLILLLFSCAGGTVKEQESESGLLRLFPIVEKDTLHVFPAEDDPDDAHYTFSGTPIPNPESGYFKQYCTYESEDHEFFAIGKYDLGSRYSGLVLRMPGQIASTSIRLMIWDKKNAKVRESLELAESWGDLESSYNLEASIRKSGESELEIILYKTKSTMLEPEEDEEEEMLTDSVFHYQVHEGRFTLKEAKETSEAAKE